MTNENTFPGGKANAGIDVNAFMNAMQMMISGIQNSDMGNKAEMQDFTYRSRLNEFNENERKMSDALFHLLSDCFAEYFSQEQLRRMSETFTRLRHRSDDVSGQPEAPITTDRWISSSINPSFRLNKAELYLICYIMMPYCNVTRVQMAEVMQKMFPGLFMDTSIRSMRTKLTQNTFMNSGKKRTFKEHRRLGALDRIIEFSQEGIERFLLSY